MRDRTATRFGSCITPLVLGAIQFAFTQVLPWTFVQAGHPQSLTVPPQQAAPPSPQHALAHKPHGLPPPVVKDLLKGATKLPAVTTEDAFEDSLPALTESFAAAE